jgi:maltose/moltooligosaccharide transporter
VQPLIGALSDRTTSRWGRRTPYFLIGAILCSLGLLAMPYSPTLWMAASLLWILDAANNVTMEPYRAFVSDKLPASQHTLGFLTQSAFTGLGQTLAYLTPSLLVWIGMDKDAVNGSHIPQVVVAAFLIGAVCSLVSVLWSVKTTPEDPLPAEKLAAMRAAPGGWRHTLAEIGAAVRDMPLTMKQLALVKLFQWYAMFCYWQFITLSLARTLFGTSDAASPGFRDAGLLNGQIGAFYNFVAFLAAFALVPFARRIGPHVVHAVCLLLAGAGMLAIPHIHTPVLLLVPMVGIGLAWASIMGNPYVILASSLPPERTGVYMGIFNMFIVIPMIIQIFTLPLVYRGWLGGNPENVIRLAGALLICAAGAMRLVRYNAPGAIERTETAYGEMERDGGGVRRGAR